MSEEHKAKVETNNDDGKMGNLPEEKVEHQKTVSKKPYTKPTLRKFSQIDYVTAYGID